MRSKIKIPALLLVIFLGSCSPFSVASDYDQNVSFDTYKSYGIKSENLETSDLDRDRLVSAIRNSMSGKGLEESSSPDVIVNLKTFYEVIVNMRKILNEKGVLLEGYDPLNNNWGWGGIHGGYWGVKRKYRNSPISHRQGGLIMDFIDAKSEKLIWQGMGSGINIDDRKLKIKQIPKIVEKILKTFPPK